MSERAKLFEALMRHLWSYWLRMPATNKNFYGHTFLIPMTHLQHAQTLMHRMEHEEEAELPFNAARERTD